MVKNQTGDKTEEKENRRTTEIDKGSRTDVYRTYRDTVFRMLFRDKENLLSLYNAINGTDYSQPEALKINTLDNAIYMSMKNDVSCVLDLRLNLYEHQSTVNPNMPLRDLFYVAKMYEKMTWRQNIYSSKLIRIPRPKFIVLYNGETVQPERKELRLSNSFYPGTEDVNLELVVLQLNINPGYNIQIVKNCQILYEYIQYTDRVRRHSRNVSLSEAVERAVSECIREGILQEFLQQNKAEVISMSIFEYDEARHMQMVRQEGWEDGYLAGGKKGHRIALIQMALRMIEKGLSLEEIADILEEEESQIAEIVQAVTETKSHDPEEIYQYMNPQEEITI